ncbi:hypothetical protein C2G38_2223860 [Gigaspora rosea]|uniref:Uncharacterized protein n=1 Tax=Gigaspora rosea TaxID=44941 RepID=A0A397U9U3_9GLOM|nr:hypothetical protein C2G38_2223860 [Gigaspora rosea]
MATDFQDIFSDLTSPQNRGVEINMPTFDPARDLHAQVIVAYIIMQQMQRQEKRKEALGYAFFIGQLIETMTTTLAQRTACRNLLTKYYATVVERVSYIFRRWGTDQITRTKKLNFQMIRDLRLSEYQSLL